MANGDPILVFCDESDARIGDFSRCPSCRSRRLPRSTIRHRAVRSSPIDSEREHLSLLPAENCRASIEHFLRRRIRMAGRGGCYCAEANRRSKPTDRNKEAIAFVLSCSRISSFLVISDSCFVILTASLLNSPQEKSRPEKCDQRSRQQELLDQSHKIARRRHTCSQAERRGKSA